MQINKMKQNLRIYIMYQLILVHLQCLISLGMRINQPICMVILNDKFKIIIENLVNFIFYFNFITFTEDSCSLL